MPTSSAAISSAPTSVVGSIAGGAGGPPQVVVASTMGMNNGGSALNGITTNCVQSQPMMTSQPQRMPTMPNAPNQNINLVTALQGNPGGPQLQPGKNWQKLLKFFKRCIYKFEMFLKWAFLNLRHFQWIFIFLRNWELLNDLDFLFWRVIINILLLGFWKKDLTQVCNNVVASIKTSLRKLCKLQKICHFRLEFEASYNLLYAQQSSLW